MYYFIINLIFSAIAICSSIPIALAHSIPLLDILTNFFAFVTFSGCLCGFLIFVIRPITKIKFNPNLKIYKVPQWEQSFYKKIKIDKWKFIIPDFGNLVKFKKKVDFSQARNAQFYEKFLYENINASLLHFTDIILTPLFFFFIRPEFYLSIGLVGFLLVLTLNILPVMLQRSLRPRFLKIYNKLSANEQTTSAVQAQAFDLH